MKREKENQRQCGIIFSHCFFLILSNYIFDEKGIIPMNATATVKNEKNNEGKKRGAFGFLFGTVLLIGMLLLMTRIGIWPVFLGYMAIMLIALFAPHISKYRNKLKLRNRRSSKAKVAVHADENSTDTLTQFSIKHIGNRIGDKLFKAYGGNAGWRWVAHLPTYNGQVLSGVGRIETENTLHKFIDVCLKDNGCLTLHAVGTGEEIVPASIVSATTPVIPPAPQPPKPSAIPLDSPEGVAKWYNIVFSGALSSLINDLNAQGHLSLSIEKNGRAYVFVMDSPTALLVHDFGDMPDKSHWEIVMEKLEEEGLIAGERDGALFISWPHNDEF